MCALDKVPSRALIAAAILAGAAFGVMPGAVHPVYAQDASPPPENPDNWTIEITPDMAPENGARTLRRRPDLPPPDGSSAINREGRGARGGNDERSGPPSVLVILAHPDDEITMAPVLARMARSGSAVTIVFATSGDAGPGVSGLDQSDQREELAALRESEARCSAFALGLPDPIFWQLGDGTLAQSPRSEGSAARQMEENIASLFALSVPQVVMTWGPDGGYGHADHRMVSNAVTQIIGAMGDARPDLLYAAFPASDEAGAALPGFENWATTHPSLITDRIRYETPDLDAARHAVDCYQSQFDENARAILAGILHQNVWKGTVYFRLAFTSTR